MTKLEPTEAQRELMIQAILDNSGFGPKSAARIVDAQIAAANSIPEGPPVGTIARRPDGGYIAIANELGWEYFYLDVRKPRLDTDGDHADSWPQIRPDEWPDPDEYHEGDKPRLERLMREPSVFEAHLKKLEVIEVLDALSRLDGTVKSAVKLLTGLSDERLEELGGFSDPTAQQEPALRERFPEQASAYVADPELVEVDDEPLPSGSLITVDVRKWEDTPAHQELEDPGPPSNAHIKFTQAPRTPRVVDRLGVDEQGSRWRDRVGDEWWYTALSSSWSYRSHIDGVVGVGNPLDMYAPYVGILEPRQLPSLDCEEARDGTVWQARYELAGVGVERTPGWRFQYLADGWEVEGSRLRVPELLAARGPYTEVLGDPS